MRNIKSPHNIKIFFNISSRSDEYIQNAALKIFNQISKLGFQHSYNYQLDEKQINDSQIENLYVNALKSLQQADIVVLEISTNSFTQGYILQKSLEIGKPVIALHQKGKYSIFVKGIKNTLLQTVEYDQYSLGNLLQEALDYAVENLMTKFNFYLSSEINGYLNWASRKKQQPKSEFVRDLIRHHMSEDVEYRSSLS